MGTKQGICNELRDRAKALFAEDSSGEDTRKRSNDLKGDPGSIGETQTKDGELKQRRKYAEDGFPEYDDDFDHDHGQGKPHRYYWDRPEDGSPPTYKDRQHGVPIPE